MDLNKKMSIDKENIIIKVRNKKAYIYNKKNKKKIFLNEEIVNYLMKGVNQEVTFLEFVNSFNEDDKNYILQLIEILNDMEVFESKDINTKQIKCIHVALTYKCNLECKHCCAESSPMRETNLFLEDWKLVIDRISTLNPQQVVFSGGEPLILNYFEELVLYSSEKMKNTIFILSTNGTLINKYSIDFLRKYFYKIDISLDGYDRESADLVRGKGTFDKVMDNIKLLKQNSVNNINLSFTQGDLNQKNSEKFKLLCSELGVTNVIRAFSPEGRGKENIDLFLSENKMLPLSVIKMFEDGLYSCSQSQENTQENNKISSIACNGGEGQLFIDDKGNVYPCPSLIIDKFKITNMMDEDYMNKILEFKGGYTLYESIISQSTNCKTCDLNIFCWCCPANFERAFKVGDVEYWCDHMKGCLNKIIWNEG